MKDQINLLKKQKKAVILAHCYAPADAQEVADFVGDSFYLARAAKETEADIIVFCGVYFMGESAKMLNPHKKVLMPDTNADCAMAHMVAPGVIDEMRARYSDLAVVCYINSEAALKAQSDVCVTSSNAVRIVKALPQKNIFFIPDRNLGRFVAQQVPEKNIILNDGCCPVHAALTGERVKAAKKLHPEAPVLAHPECEPEVLELADFVGSTSDIIKYAKQDGAEEYIICTEQGVDHRLRADNPHKRFYYPDSCLCCRDMKLNTLENILSALKNEEPEVQADEKLFKQALAPLDRMLEMAK